MGNQEGEGYTAERFWRLALATGERFHNAAVGDTEKCVWSEEAAWLTGILDLKSLFTTYLFFLTMRLGN